MPYSDKVTDHFNNPRNVGSMDISLKDVGTGIVGAPECFSGETLIATADGKRFRTLRSIYESGKIIPIWSFNRETNSFEIQNAKGIFSGEKEMYQIFLSDGGNITVTKNHEFLIRPSNKYLENQLITGESIRTFRRQVSKRGYWHIREANTCTEEYRAIFKFYTKITKINGNIHHIDFNKRNDIISNLELLSIKEHIKKHTLEHNFPDPDMECCKSLRKLNKLKTRSEIANELGIYTDELYFYEKKCGLHKHRIRSWDEIYQMSSERMKKNNPYSQFSNAQKLKFATHPGKSNGKWIEVDNDTLVNYGHILFKEYGKLTASIWQNFADKNFLPQQLQPRFGSWNTFKNLCISGYNHKIVDKKANYIKPAFTLQVEQNNNYVVLTNITQNIQEGIVVKNCGDVMKLQIKVDDNNRIIDAKFKTFGCGSAIASSSLATEWVKGKTLDEATKIKNTEIVQELSLPPVKIHCSVLAEDAIRAAIADIKQKRNI